MRTWRVARLDQQMPVIWYLAAEPYQRHKPAWQWHDSPEKAIVLDEAEACRLADLYNALPEERRRGTTARAEQAGAGLMARPRLPRPEGKPPTREELLNVMEQIELHADARRAHPLVAWVVWRGHPEHPGCFIAQLVAASPLPYALKADTLAGVQE